MFKYISYGPRRLVPAQFGDEHFWLLIELSGLRSENIILSLKEYLVEGFPRKAVCERNGVSSSYFSICLKRISYINSISEKLSEHYINN
ncbi:PapB/FocB family fimbrial expression transcriptional regulator [Escherichia coli]|uniref:PapB/FocB family fimbrial expression transcriptional regulator n=1 Tax=Escherichia coli TaxID=562 RepID=UPI0038B660F4